MDMKLYENEQGSNRTTTTINAHHSKDESSIKFCISSDKNSTMFTVIAYN